MITKYLLEKDPTLQAHNEGKWSNTVSEYSAFNSGGVECEVGEFLYGLVRVTKPDQILETGTHHFVAGAYMTQALKDNSRGKLLTIEFSEENYRIAKERARVLDVLDYVQMYLMPVQEFKVGGREEFDIIFLDTEPNLRFNELVRFYPSLKQGGFVFIHDTPRSLCQGNINPDHPEIESWPFGNLPDQIKEWVKEDKLRPFHFPNPRGMIGFYRVAEGDHIW